MNEKEIKVLNEIIDNMDKILIEKQILHKDAWKTCSLTKLRVRLVQTINKLFLTPDYNRELRELIHIFNYAFFLYYRLKIRG